jgi:spore coat polysaccharide biosynthesis protein SpsF (cytidylyltransferase family)
MKLAAIIQARTGSTRLPGKVLMDLEGETVLSRVVRRAQRSALIHEVVIATTTSGGDDAIVKEGRRLGVSVFCGQEMDVLDRYWQASLASGAAVIVRITSDCPLIDPGLVDQTIHAYLDQQADYASNDSPPTYPRGLDVEVFSAPALKRTWKEADAPYQREHVTPYIYEHPAIFRLASVTSEIDYSYHRWTLDTAEDLEFLRAVYARFHGRENFGWQEVLQLVEMEPALAAANAHVPQKHLKER